MKIKLLLWALFVPLVLSANSAKAQFYIIDSVINIPPFTQQIETIGKEVKEKTRWHLYLVTVDDIGKQSLIEYQKELSKRLEKPFITLALAIKQQKVSIYGSEGYRNVIDYEGILFDDIYPILGAKIKTDPRQKYLSAMLNGYSEIAEELADHYNVELKSAVGNTNKVTINILRVLFYGTIIAALGVYFYRKYFKKRG